MYLHFVVLRSIHHVCVFFWCRLFALDTLRFGAGFVFWSLIFLGGGGRVVTNGDNVVCCFNFEMRKVCNGVEGGRSGRSKRSSRRSAGHKGEVKRLKNCICCLWLG